jgi:hypothetical protein
MRAALATDAELVALLGGTFVFDEVPRGAKPPFISVEQVETRDWSTQGDSGLEHFVQLQVMTAERARGRAQAICERVQAVLDGAPLTLAGHALINLRLIFWSVSRTRSEPAFGATLRFRAATEPL